jgi:hypothetical protein
MIAEPDVVGGAAAGDADGAELEPVAGDVDGAELGPCAGDADGAGLTTQRAEDATPPVTVTVLHDGSGCGGAEATAGGEGSAVSWEGGNVVWPPQAIKNDSTPSTDRYRM